MDVVVGNVSTDGAINLPDVLGPPATAVLAFLVLVFTRRRHDDAGISL